MLRAVDIIGFAVCAGTALIWGIFDPVRLHGLLLAGMVIFSLRLLCRGGDAGDSDTLHRISGLFYAQGLEHGLKRARGAGGEDSRGQDLPRVG
ncbi:hypothetical protein [Actinomadura rudentiformis]|uniref:Uncharacterized protein n=1 Tax=Actinomadura rudentiformis TaxID=359158 RepID=A0A6H9YXF8_9ACTN|nr:hypothetical protein [Actinomadura rudentiformis]KAB2347284.1 hypothetical protein F8566_19930 [Actinomadura rudentiformis]